ncbi:hypothetical protein NQ317_000823, partial [Molorchus minor]
TLAAPPVESCPPDSILFEIECKCNPESCMKPPCLSTLTIAKNGSDVPGSCCPIYDCVDCSNDTLIDGRCPCAPEAKSVAVTVNEGCCKKTICKPCPSDSESTHMDSGKIEDLCVCLPCKTECGNNRTVEIIRRGTNFPGSCCDLYECKKVDEMKGCNVENIFYSNGEEWNLGKEETTALTVLVQTAKKNAQTRCATRLRTINKKTECQPLSNCNKTCVNGFKINKKGCEICKCTSVRFTQDILGKYNITMKDLIVILDNYANRRAATTTTTTTTTTISSISDPVTVVPPASINIITNMFTEDLSSTTTEPSIVPADESTNYWTIALPILVLLSVGCVALVVLIVICIYKNRRKSSLDLSHCHYETVNNLNNNNTIKKN